MTWKFWTPERDGHAPDDWVAGTYVEAKTRPSTTWHYVTRPCWDPAFTYRYRPLQDATYESDCVTRAQYESAVKGRQDFRNAYRSLLPVLRAAEELSRLWRTKGQRVDDKAFFDAINAIDVAVTGGGAKPDPEHLIRPAQDEEPDLLAQCLALPQDQREVLIEAMQKKWDLVDDPPCTDCHGTGYNDCMERRCDCSPLSEAQQLAENLEQINRNAEEMLKANEAKPFSNAPDIVERLWKLAPHSAKPTDAILIEDAATTITKLLNQLEDLHDGMADALQKIAAPLNCGCKPCTSACRSAEALQYELEARQDIAIAALAALKAVQS